LLHAICGAQVMRVQVLSLKEDFTFSKFVGLFLDKSESSRLQIEGL